ncbi:MAG: DUF6438 domain-containing protein [Deltaproteobacteria bacterium]
MKIFFLFLVPFLFFVSCNTTKLETDASKAAPVIVYSKGPCFGQCPIYTLTIYNSGLVKYNSVRYTKKTGKYEKQLDAKAYNEIIKAFKESRFWRFNDDYGMELVDAPTITIAFNENGKTKSVKGKSKFPEKLKELMTILDKFEPSDDSWNVIEKVVAEVKPEEIIDNQIIIKTGEGMILASWLQQYKEYGVRLMSKINGTEDTWLIRFDKTKIDPQEMLKIVKADKFIAEAQFNTKTSDRQN